MRLYLMIFCFFSFTLVCKAQKAIIDSSSTVIAEDTLKHSPLKASILSAVLPGAGQVYNSIGAKKKKYWKVPIIYAGLGTSAYLFFYNRNQYIWSKEAYLGISRDSIYTEYGAEVNYKGLYELDSDREQFRSFMEISVIAFAAVYALQIIDASVDAHLFYFDVSNDLSFQFQPIVSPSLFAQKPSYGFNLKLNF